MATKIEGWPEGVEELFIRSKADGSSQPSLALAQRGRVRRPLLVALHTWSFGRRQHDGENVYAKWCVENGWHFIHPDFRGANDKPAALGSALAVSDVEDAVDFMRGSVSVDEDRIYLVGVSGGGHMSLLLAGKRPALWAGVSSWCPIFDVLEWHRQCKRHFPPLKYYKDIEQACAGDPESRQASAWECEERAPSSCLSAAKGLNLDVNSGVRDGRSGSVPFSHALYAFNAVASQADAIADAEIERMYKTQRLPADSSLRDELYGSHSPLFRRRSGNARVTIFDGGHEIVHLAALNWLAVQRRGKPAVWKVEKPIALDSAPGSCAAGK